MLPFQHVVSVVVTAEVLIIEQYYEEYTPFGGLFGGRGFAVPRQRQIGTEEREIGGGSGFFVSPDGYLVTNRHVVDQEDVSYSIVTNDGDSYEVEVVARDPMLDIAIVRVVGAEDEVFPHLTFSSQDARLGQTVIAIGNALAEFPNSVSVGVVSGLARNIVASSGFGQSELLEGVIQTDAAINQGNSGGPLLTTDGEVMGVNVAAAGGTENIGFALPADIVFAVYESVATFGEIRRPFLGVRYEQVTQVIAAERELNVDFGVLIIPGATPLQPAVVSDSPAARAGLQEGDVIVAIDDEVLDSEQSFASILRQYAAGDTVTLRVVRNDEEQQVEVVLGTAPEM